MNFKTWALGAIRASFPPSREDRRQTPRGGLGDLEDEDRRHLAVLFAAGPDPPVYNGLLPVDRSDADGICISALSVYESGTPPSQKIQHHGGAVKGSAPAEKGGRPLPPPAPRGKPRPGPPPHPPITAIGPLPPSPAPAAP